MEEINVIRIETIEDNRKFEFDQFKNQNEFEKSREDERKDSELKISTLNCELEISRSKVKDLWRIFKDIKMIIESGYEESKGDQISLQSDEFEIEKVNEETFEDLLRHIDPRKKVLRNKIKEKVINFCQVNLSKNYFYSSREKKISEILRDIFDSYSI
ncbi:MAG: hypothetical protein MHMPM18_003091 [Marteilia pararefringens]